MGLPVLIVGAVLCYTVFGLMAGKAGGRIDSSLSSVLFNGIGTLLPLTYYLLSRAVADGPGVATTSRGIMYSLIAGVGIGAFSILLVEVLGRGGVNFGIPTIYGSSIVAVAIAGWLLFGDKPSGLHFAGIGVTALGVGIVAFASSR
jgi:drug/metabolite transporter (DMT)-like permease